jgi:iron(III) transport system permease protein
MISCLWLEQPGKWRTIAVALILGLALLPALPLTVQALPAWKQFGIDRPFASALGSSAVVAVLVFVFSWLFGLPLGVCTSLYDWPGRKFLLPLAALPLLLPSFLWAIGWSALAAQLGPRATAVVSGYSGCILVFVTTTFPLVLLTAHLVTGSLSGSQVDSARLAGGERTVLWQACRHAAPVAGLAAALGSVFTLSDPGPGLILGLRSAAGEILTSFASLYRFELAGFQCAVLALVVLCVTLPLVWLTAPRLASQLMARQARCFQRSPHSPAQAAGVVLALGVVGFVALPLAGLLFPLTAGIELSRAGREVQRTAVDTLLYAAGAGTTATALGFLLALSVGRRHRLQITSVGICLMLFALPPALAGLGIVQTAAAAPAWLDFLLRTRLTVCLTLGLRFVPVATVLGLRAWSAMPVSWAQAAAIHGVPLGSYGFRVLLPYFLPAAATSVLLVGLLGTADIGTVLLVQPPGHASLPLAIFTVMANAPEALVATLCLTYAASAAGLLVLAWLVAGRMAA